jgi:hypothetical protein
MRKKMGSYGSTCTAKLRFNCELRKSVEEAV